MIEVFFTVTQNMLQLMKLGYKLRTILNVLQNNIRF